MMCCTRAFRSVCALPLLPQRHCALLLRLFLSSMDQTPACAPAAVFSGALFVPRGPSWSCQLMSACRSPRSPTLSGSPLCTPIRSTCCSECPTSLLPALPLALPSLRSLPSLSLLLSSLCLPSAFSSPPSASPLRAPLLTLPLLSLHLSSLCLPSAALSAMLFFSLLWHPPPHIHRSFVVFVCSLPLFSSFPPLAALIPFASRASGLFLLLW